MKELREMIDEIKEDVDMRFYDYKILDALNKCYIILNEELEEY